MPNPLKGMGDVDPVFSSTQSRRQPLSNKPEDTRSIFERLYSDAFVPARGAVANFLGGTPDNNAHRLHEYYSEKAGETLTPYIGEGGAQTVVDIAGHLNEIPSYWAQIFSGKPGFSQQGFDFGDIEANNAGLQRGFDRARGTKRNPLARFGTRL